MPSIPLRPIWLLAVIGLVACTSSPAPDDYFPLQKGLRWDYEVVERNPVTDARRLLQVRNLGSATLDGQQRFRRLASDGNEYWLERNDEGVQRVAARTAVDRLPQPDAAPRTVLRLPPQIGQWWEVESRPYILERVEPFRERFWHDPSKRVEIKMTVAALDDVVEVPAGRFENCLRLEGEGILPVLADARIGASEVPVQQTEWYAPGVGLVQLLRTEVLDTPQIVGGEVRMQLLQFHR